MLNCTPPHFSILDRDWSVTFHECAFSSLAPLHLCLSVQKQFRIDPLQIRHQLQRSNTTIDQTTQKQYAQSAAGGILEFQLIKVIKKTNYMMDESI